MKIRSKKKKYSESESESSEGSSVESFSSSSSDSESSVSSGYSSKKRKLKCRSDNRKNRKEKEKRDFEVPASDDDEKNVLKRKNRKSRKSDSDSDEPQTKLEKHKIKEKESRKRDVSSDIEKEKSKRHKQKHRLKEDKEQKDKESDDKNSQYDKHKHSEIEEKSKYYEYKKETKEVSRNYGNEQFRKDKGNMKDSDSKREKEEERRLREESRRDRGRDSRREIEDGRRDRDSRDEKRREREKEQNRYQNRYSADNVDKRRNEGNTIEDERWKHDGYEKHYGKSNRNRSPGRQRRRSPKFIRNNERRSRSKSFDHANAKWGKEGDSKTIQKDKIKPVEKQKPNFALSGKLTEETNTYRGVVIKYSEPPEARKPKRRWRLYPFKGEKALQTLYIHRESAYLIGRDRKVVDLPVDHPSCSKQHAVLQYRLVPFTRDDGSSGKRVRPYLIDLESANGTYINNKKIEPKKYIELLEKDVIKFGFSSREYVLLHENSKDEGLDDDVKQEEEEVAVKEEPDN
ncbi:FHA domain-containing protein DDL isoform X2 [Agrilus planipennis]|uniref:FHA domain-containing protein DDL isoform X2 n=1 Tax=Agrilus planipennis TaxID=224129 RepID=A0A1W4XI61_AGRPL|nr:FHA domain-containing protein DDL isoform X2 [Agrilus planipennis]